MELYGSFQNRIAEIATRGQPEPTVGMGATFLSFSDRSPGTISEVFKIGKSLAIKVQGCNYRVIKGSTHDGSAQYGISPDWDGPGSTWKFDGKQWCRMRFNSDTKRWTKMQSGGLAIGYRDAYYDPSF